MCTENRAKIFWDTVGATRGRPHLSALGHIVTEEIEGISAVYPDVRVDKYVVMPNHIHLILVIEGNNVLGGRPRVAPTVSRVIQQTKGRISKRAGFSVWQKSFYDHMIRNETDYINICTYIENNPIKWEDDCYYKG